MSLIVAPLSRDEANHFVAKWHRHHGPLRGSKFCIGAAKDGCIVGVAMVGRPSSRHLNNGWTLEVTRLATDGTKNACSFLYGAAWRAARALGYERLLTYTLPEEGGASLRAAGWRVLGESKGGPWSRAGRPRVDVHPLQRKLRWEAPAVPT